MRKLVFLVLLVLPGCAGLTPDFYKTVDDIATDGVLQIQLDREAFNKETNVRVVIDIKNNLDSK